MNATATVSWRSERGRRAAGTVSPSEHGAQAPRSPHARRSRYGRNVAATLLSRPGIAKVVRVSWTLPRPEVLRHGTGPMP